MSCLDKLEAKHIFGMFAIGTVALIQGIAWATGHNGTVFALTSAVIGGVTGTILGFGYAKK